MSVSANQALLAPAPRARHPGDTARKVQGRSHDPPDHDCENAPMKTNPAHGGSTAAKQMPVLKRTTKVPKAQSVGEDRNTILPPGLAAPHPIRPVVPCQKEAWASAVGVTPLPKRHPQNDLTIPAGEPYDNG